jgi:hypothetical protein
VLGLSDSAAELVESHNAELRGMHCAVAQHGTQEH